MPPSAVLLHVAQSLHANAKKRKIYTYHFTYHNGSLLMRQPRAHANDLAMSHDKSPPMLQELMACRLREQTTTACLAVE